MCVCVYHPACGCVAEGGGGGKTLWSRREEEGLRGAEAEGRGEWEPVSEAATCGSSASFDQRVVKCDHVDRFLGRTDMGTRRSGDCIGDCFRVDWPAGGDLNAPAASGDLGVLAANCDLGATAASGDSDLGVTAASGNLGEIAASGPVADKEEARGTRGDPVKREVEEARVRGKVTKPWLAPETAPSAVSSGPAGPRAARSPSWPSE